MNSHINNPVLEASLDLKLKQVLEAGWIMLPENKQLFKKREGMGHTKWLADSRGAGTKDGLMKLLVDAMGLVIESLKDSDLITSEIIMGGVSEGGVRWADGLFWNGYAKEVVTIRQEAKKSGAGRTIEGEIDGRNVLLIDNVSNSGASLQQAAEAIQEAGGIPQGCLVFAMMNEDMVIESEAHEIPIYAVWSYSCIEEKARQLGLL